MEETLTPAQLAEIKREGRKARIRLIRRRVAMSVATLAAIFTGLILVRSVSFAGTPASTIANATSGIPVVGSDGGDHESDDHDDDESEDHTDDGDNGFSVSNLAQSVVSPSTASSDNTAPSPPPITSSQS